jgi:2-amino-4-hydroxy-6-hydroxymethyldihydropteridine diphosphokinase
MKTAIGLGSSLGNRRRQLQRAVNALDRTAGLTILRGSRWYRTPPMAGGSATGWFLNGVVLLESMLDPHEVLRRCRELESGAGRRRSKHWGDRALDLDVLLVEGVVRQNEDLVLPHPGIASRSFVLRPLLEVWPTAHNPNTGIPYAELAACPGPQAVPVGVVAVPRRSL